MTTAFPILWTAKEFAPVVKAPSTAAAYDAMRKLPKAVKVQIGRKVFVNADAFVKYVADGGDQQ